MGGKDGAAFTGQYHEQLHTLETLSQIFNKPLNQLKLERLQTKTINWRLNPHTQGSYSCPQPGYYTTGHGALLEPELNGQLWFVGEHCSIDWQGFMNGAVESATAVAAAMRPYLTAKQKAS